MQGTIVKNLHKLRFYKNGTIVIILSPACHKNRYEML